MFTIRCKLMFLISYHSMLQMLLEAPFLSDNVVCSQASVHCGTSSSFLCLKQKKLDQKKLIIKKKYIYIYIRHQ